MRTLVVFLGLLFSLFPVKGALPATFQADTVPWSGYWWPFTSGGVATGIGYNRHPSPLEKYDLVTVERTNGPATAYGMQHYYDPEALFWAGLCFNWAAAAILEEEPVHKGVYQNTTFLVGDKKALLTVAYDGTLYKTYRFNDPVDFHDVLEEFIADQKTPIMMDLGTEGEVWFFPVFKYETDYTQEGDIRHYTTTIYYASDAVRPDYIGTLVSSSTYYYYFRLDGAGNITDMGWEGKSIGHAPVRACEPFGTEPNNPGIDYDVVKQIVLTDDDPHEENDSSESGADVATGAYNLIVMDDDFFHIHLKQGDRLKIELASETADISLKTYDPGGTRLDETEGGGVQIIEAEENGEYTLEVRSGEPEAEYLYTLYLEHRLSFRAIFPFNPAGSWRTGVSLLDNDGNGGRKIISLFDDDGHPQKSCSIQPGASLLGLIEEDFRLTHDEKMYIKIDSDSPLLGLEASVALGYLLLGENLMPLDDSSGEIFFPHFSNKGGWKTTFGLINTGDYTEEVLRRSFGTEGQILNTQTVTLAPGERLEEETASIPILVTGARCMSAETLSNRASLLGYILFFSPSKFNERALVTLAGAGSSEITIPHVAYNDYWWTGVAVMNTGNDDADLLCLAYDESGDVLAQAEYLLEPKENLVQYAPNLFPAALAGHIASIKISSQGGEPICGLILYGSKDNNSLAGMSIAGPRELPAYLPHIASSNGWWTGIGLVNSGIDTASITFSLLDKDSNVLAERYWSLNENAHLAITIKDLFQTSDYEGARYLKIDSLDRGLMSGIYLIGPDNGLGVMGDILK